VRTTIAARLTGLGATGLIAILTVGGMAYLGLQQEIAAADRMASVSSGMSRMWSASTMHAAIRADVMSALVSSLPEDSRALDPEGVSAHATTLVRDFDAAARQAPAALRQQFVTTRPDVLRYTGMAQDVVRLAGEDPGTAEGRLPDFLEVSGAVEDRLDAIAEQMSAAVLAEERTGHQILHRWEGWMVLVSALVSLAFGVLVTLIVREVVRPLRRLAASLDQVAAGDFQVRLDLDRQDEIGDVAGAVDRTVVAVQESLRVIDSCSTEVYAAVEQLSTDARDLASAAEQTSERAGASVGLAERVCEKAREVAAGVEMITKEAQGIATSADTAIEVGDRAAEGANAASSTISRLGESSKQVSGVAAMIRSIADQTRLLALNATIEAARAGDAGRGFAVVASEVKDLAQEVGRATEDISSRIAAIESDVEDAISSIATVTGVIDEITAHQGDISGAVQFQASQSGSVASKIEGATAEADQIAGSVHVIASAAVQTSATATRAREAAGTLAQTAERMRATLSGYRF